MKNYKAEITQIIQDQDMGYTMSRFEPETVDKILSLFREIAKEAKPQDVYTEDDALVAIDKYQSSIEKMIGGK